LKDEGGVQVEGGGRDKEREGRESTKGCGRGDEDIGEGAYSGEEGDGDMAMIVA
jgi:hypothetical protein